LISKYILDFGDILNCLNRKGESIIEYKKVLITRLNLLKIQNSRDFFDLKIEKKYFTNIDNNDNNNNNDNYNNNSDDDKNNDDDNNNDNNNINDNNNDDNNYDNNDNDDNNDTNNNNDNDDNKDNEIKEDVDRGDVYIESFLGFGVRKYSREMRHIMILMAECYCRLGKYTHTYMYVHMHIYLDIHDSFYT
jgi:hypothetical protein